MKNSEGLSFESSQNSINESETSIKQVEKVEVSEAEEQNQGGVEEKSEQIDNNEKINEIDDEFMSEVVIGNDVKNLEKSLEKEDFDKAGELIKKLGEFLEKHDFESILKELISGQEKQDIFKQIKELNMEAMDKYKGLVEVIISKQSDTQEIVKKKGFKLFHAIIKALFEMIKELINPEEQKKFLSSEKKKASENKKEIKLSIKIGGNEKEMEELKNRLNEVEEEIELLDEVEQNLNREESSQSDYDVGKMAA